MVLLLISILVISALNGFSENLVSETLSSPTLSVFENLQELYPKTLSCPCQTSSFTYGNFLSVTPVYHQVRLVTLSTR